MILQNFGRDTENRTQTKEAPDDDFMDLIRRLSFCVSTNPLTFTVSSFCLQILLMFYFVFVLLCVFASSFLLGNHSTLMVATLVFRISSSLCACYFLIYHIRKSDNKTYKMVNKFNFRDRLNIKNR